MNSRLIGIGLLFLAAAGLYASIPAMVGRLGDREDLKDRPVVWFQEPLLDESLKINGEPLRFEITEPADEASEDRTLRIVWRGQTHDLPILGKDDPRLPGLMRFEDWLAVLPMLEGRGSSQADVIEQLERGEVRPRIIIAARYPAEGFHPESWGLVRRKDWPYRFIELHEDGPAEASIEVTERTYGELEAIFAPGPYADDVDLTPAERDAIFWQHQAMLRVTPDVLYRAKDKQVEAGMVAMGWTWPVAGVSIMLLVAGLAVFASGGVTQ